MTLMKQMNTDSLRGIRESSVARVCNKTRNYMERSRPRLRRKDLRYREKEFTTI